MNRAVFAGFAMFGFFQLGVFAGQGSGTADPRLTDPAFVKARDEAQAGAKCADRTDPVAKSTPSPLYPEELKSERVWGTAIVEGIVLRDGCVAFARVMRASRPEFGSAALEALKQYRYKPGTCGGEPVPRFVTITHTFTF